MKILYPIVLLNLLSASLLAQTNPAPPAAQTTQAAPATQASPPTAAVVEQKYKGTFFVPTPDGYPLENLEVSKLPSTQSIEELQIFIKKDSASIIKKYFELLSSQWGIALGPAYADQAIKDYNKTVGSVVTLDGLNRFHTSLVLRTYLIRKSGSLLFTELSKQQTKTKELLEKFENSIELQQKGLKSLNSKLDSGQDSLFIFAPKSIYHVFSIAGLLLGLFSVGIYLKST